MSNHHKRLKRVEQTPDAQRAARIKRAREMASTATEDDVQLLSALECDIKRVEQLYGAQRAARLKRILEAVDALTDDELRGLIGQMEDEIARIQKTETGVE